MAVRPVHPGHGPSARRRAPLPAATFLFLLVLGPAAPRQAHAINYTWTGATSIFAGTSTNWNPNGVPGPADWVFFNTAGTYDVTFGVVVPATTEFQVRDGSPQLRFPTAHTVSTVFIVGNSIVGPTPTPSILSGTLNLSNNFGVGTNVNADAKLTVTGLGTALNATSLPGWNWIGSEGTGELDVYDGANVTLAHAPEIGRSALGNDGTGTLTVLGLSTTDGSTPSSLVVTDVTNPVRVGAGGSTGTLNVAFGGRADVAGGMTLADSPGGTGTVVVGAALNGDSAQVSIGGDLNLTRNTGNVTAGGTATFDAEPGSITEVAGTTWTYDDVAGGLGQLQVRTGARFSTHDLRIGDPATELAFTGGTLQVTGGTLELNGKPLAIGDPVGLPTLELLAGSTCDVTSATSPALALGTTGRGALHLRDGSTLTVHDFGFFVGDSPGSTSDLVVDSGSHLTVDQSLIVGRNGIGTMTLAGQAQVIATNLGLATQAGEAGSLVTVGDQSDLHVTTSLEVSGLSSGGSGSSSSVDVLSGGRLWLEGPLTSGEIWQGGAVQVSDAGELHLTGVLADRGNMAVIQGGSTDGGVIQPLAGGVLVGSGTVHSAIVALTDSSGHVYADDDLVIGRTVPLGFQFAGQLHVGPHDVTLVDSDSAVVGTVALAGGTLRAPAGGIDLPADRLLTGTGTVSGPFRPLGHVVATGAAGLAFDGPVLGQGQEMSGTRIRMLAGGALFGGVGNFGGTGILGASVQVDSGGAVLAFNDMTLGSGAGSRVTVNGLLAMNDCDVDIVTADSTRVSGLVSIVNSFLTMPAGQPLLIQRDGRLLGAGTVTGTVVVDGTFEPGAGLRRLAVDALRLRSTSKLSFEVGSVAAAQTDTVVVTGQAAIGGTLELVAVTGFTLTPGDSFLVLSAGSLVGSFSGATLYGVDASGAVALHVHGAQVWAVITNTSLAVDDSPKAGTAGGSLRFASLGSPTASPAFALDLPEASDVTVELFDVAGRLVSTLQRGPLAAGHHRLAPVPGTVRTAGMLLARARIAGPSGTVERVTRAVYLP